ncbi:UNVERIFIED_CONTAM: hypothetical protein PYX00_010735 [Menopon gallinae]|uniref:Cytochrome b-c1 complex subunit 7 n=1 Tax=Menopon gallinae TaxID=328185 RepID=A0AAW2HH55_9NEOP
MSALDKFNFNFCIYRKYGLLKDDLLRDIDPDVKEALDRIPEDMLMKRIYRSVRAQQLYLQHSVLPEEEWSKIDDVSDHEYLQPYIKEIEAENAERDLWERTH